jgi:hypothetical protein
MWALETNDSDHPQEGARGGRGVIRLRTWLTSGDIHRAAEETQMRLAETLGDGPVFNAKNIRIAQR